MNAFKIKVAFLAIAATAISHLNALALELPVEAGSGTPSSVEKNYNNYSSHSKYFSVSVPSQGDYFAEFWLMPSLSSESKYSVFEVSVNGIPSGTITPERGNWQSAGLDGGLPLHLTPGMNLISISNKGYEMPSVELMTLSSVGNAVLNSESYDTYLASAESSMDNDVVSDTLVDDYDINSTIDHGYIPLRYSFYKIFNFTEGESVILMSSSDAEHFLDITFWGTELEITDFPGDPVTSSGTSDQNINEIFSSEVYPNPHDNIFKGVMLHTPATSEEMQGLTWKGISEPALNSEKQVTKAIVKVPKTGMYLVKLRTQSSKVISTADLIVNGEYFYENVPISSSSISCNIPRGAPGYASYAKGDSYGSDDPMIFIYGGGSDKVVGFNDDAPAYAQTDFALSKFDSFISQEYKVKATGIGISNYSSYNPVSNCHVYWGIPADIFNKPAKSIEEPTPPAPSEPDGEINGHEYVDLGLPSGTLWATCNIGADTPHSVGSFFAWGETEPKESFSWNDYSYFVKYESRPGDGVWWFTEDLGEDIAGTQYDAATHLWGKGWQMPSDEQRWELKMYGWYNWVEENGICGYRVYGPNTNSIFLPACGYRTNEDDESPELLGEQGGYWTSNPGEHVNDALDPDGVSCLGESFYVEKFEFGVADLPKYYGLNIRPVAKEVGTGVTSVADTSRAFDISYENGQIKIIGTSGDYSIAIFDMAGRQVGRGMTQGNVFKTNTIADGIYIISVNDANNHKITKKIVFR